MTRLSAALLIVLGSFLEILYYSIRFTQDGSSLWLSIVIGAALTLFLAVLTMLRRDNRWSVPAAFVLAAYSVFATAAGQAAALGLIQNERSQDDAQQAIAADAIDDYRTNVARLDREEADLLASVEGMTLRERAIWATRGVAPMRERQETIAAERREWQDRIDAERSRLTTHETVERVERDIYAFYASVIGGDPRVIQITLQVVLSVFIAMMAPAGIIMLTREPTEPDPEPVETEYQKQARSWAYISWFGIRSGGKTRLLKMESVKRFADKKAWPNDLFAQVLHDAIRRAIVIEEANGAIVPAVSEEAAVEMLCGRTT